MRSVTTKFKRYQSKNIYIYMQYYLIPYCARIKRFAFLFVSKCCNNYYLVSPFPSFLSTTHNIRMGLLRVQRTLQSLEALLTLTKQLRIFFVVGTFIIEWIKITCISPKIITGKKEISQPLNYNNYYHDLCYIPIKGFDIYLAMKSGGICLGRIYIVL